jgi:hypothetical protein
MRGNRMIRANLIFSLLLASWPIAAAGDPIDKVTLEDGSVLHGEIERVKNDELILDTDYADDVVIEVEYIVDIESQQRFSVRLIDGEIISGFLVVSNGKIELHESLPTRDESGALETPDGFDLGKSASEALPATDGAEADEVAGEASSIEKSRLPQKPPGDLKPDEEMAETAEAVDIESAEGPAAAERPEGRQFTFDDVDWIREKPTYLRYEADLNIGAQVARGNSDTTDTHFDARFEPSFGWNTFQLSGYYDKKSADGDTTTDRWGALLTYERDIGRRWFAGAANSYESDAQRDLDLRVIFAGGLGYHIFDEDPTHSSILPAIAYVNENFEEVVIQSGSGPFATTSVSSDDASYVAFQLKFDFTRDLYKDDITFFHNNMYLNNLQDLNDIIVETRTGIEFDMPWDFVLTAEVETDWENEPAEDAKKWDTRYMLKIGFEFEGDEDDWFQ